jgi:hypothetical protein
METIKNSLYSVMITIHSNAKKNKTFSIPPPSPHHHVLAKEERTIKVNKTKERTSFIPLKAINL